jgi:hypothetical protein
MHTRSARLLLKKLESQKEILKVCNCHIKKYERKILRTDCFVLRYDDDKKQLFLKFLEKNNKTGRCSRENMKVMLKNSESSREFASNLNSS